LEVLEEMIITSRRQLSTDLDKTWYHSWRKAYGNLLQVSLCKNWTENFSTDWKR